MSGKRYSITKSTEIYLRDVRAGILVDMLVELCNSKEGESTEMEWSWRDITACITLFDPSLVIFKLQLRDCEETYTDSLNMNELVLSTRANA